jgi:hypothetical protein
VFDRQGDTPPLFRPRPQRSFGGTSYSSQMANHTFRTDSPASIASTALRPPSVEKTWSRATLWARIAPN